MRPELRDELVARTDADWASAQAYFEAVEGDERLTAELDELLASPATPLLAVLPAWEACPDEGAALIRVTADNAHRLGEIVRTSAWPGLAQVDGDGADAAWLIAQHADHENELRKEWVGALFAAVHAGEADPRHLACLVDRIAVVDGEPQVYGSVAAVEDGELAFLHPVRGPDRLGGRRAEIGLPPMAADAEVLELGEIVPFGPDRLDHPLLQWPQEQ